MGNKTTVVGAMVSIDCTRFADRALVRDQSSRRSGRQAKDSKPIDKQTLV